MIAAHGVALRWSPPFWMYIALVAACVATAGSLYMSEVLGWIPCTWCWYQRIAMYPLSVLLAVGLARRDAAIPRYSLWLAIPGALAAIWHILIQTVPAIALLYPCKSASPCTSDSLWSLGVFPYWMTVPMLALLAFGAIILGSVVTLLRDRSEARLTNHAQSVEGLSPRTFVALIVAPIALLFGVGGYIVNVRSAPVNQLDPNVGSGAKAFAQSCAGCHTAQAGGNLNIRRSWLTGKSEADIVAFLKKGRTVTDADNFSKQAMPPYGGQPFLTDAELAELARYVLDR